MCIRIGNKCYYLLKCTINLLPISIDKSACFVAYG